jgi:hypothetical protein
MYRVAPREALAKVHHLQRRRGGIRAHQLDGAGREKGLGDLVDAGIVVHEEEAGHKEPREARCR